MFFFYFFVCELGARAKFRNPTATPFGRKVMAGEEERKTEISKIVAYQSPYFDIFFTFTNLSPAKH